MKAVIAGGTGFLGVRLATSLRADGYDVHVLTRHPRNRGDVAWEHAAAAIDGADAVINLAGEPLDAGRWTSEQKAAIRDSRVNATRRVVALIRGATLPPRVLLSGSAVGIYGARGNEALTEASEIGADFLASVCVEWEAAAVQAAQTTRVVLLRTGLVLDRDRGALPRLALPVRLFAGGPLGSGAQHWSWIHHADWVRLARWATDAANVSGPLNLTAPEPVTNRAFVSALGRVLHRPTVAPAPAFALRLLLGEMADAMILTGQRVLPAKAEQGGFEFRYPRLDAALREIYGRA